MGFFEYLSNNLTYLFLIIGAILLITGASVARYFIIKKLEKISENKRENDEKNDNAGNSVQENGGTDAE